jgi:7,8-dihydroneopterin aldolase/epimerase/oxygenase
MAVERARMTETARPATPHRPGDRVFVKDFVLECHIGVYAQEKGVTQRVRFNVYVELARAEGPEQDDLDCAFDYDFIVDGIKALTAGRHIHLVETLAEEIARHILSDPRAAGVRVRVEKLDKGPEAFGVEIVRTQESVSRG